MFHHLFDDDRDDGRHHQERSRHGEVLCGSTATGWNNYLNGDNKAANELIKKDNPSMNDEQIAYSIAALKANGIIMSAMPKPRALAR